MTRPHLARMPKGDTCRKRRSQERRPAWVKPFVRANRAISSSARLICSTLRQVSVSRPCAQQRPVRTSAKLHQASGRLVEASVLLFRAARDLARTEACLGRDPRDAADVPELLVDAGASWVYLSEWLGEVAGDLFAFHHQVLEGLETGALVPEPPAGRRIRIVLAPRPVPVRAFLLLQQPRVVDRIAPILRRRRRTPRPAALEVPRDSHQGRAPPLSSVCPL